MSPPLTRERAAPAPARRGRPRLDPVVTGCFGDFTYDYRISRYEITNGHYTDFFHRPAQRARPCGDSSQQCGLPQRWGPVGADPPLRLSRDAFARVRECA